MAVQTITQLKAWFSTGLKPLQQQFWDWLDSYRHVNTPIGISDLSADLQALLNTVSAGAVKVVLTAEGVAGFVMPAGSWLQSILFLDANNPAISVGITNGGNEVYEAMQLANGYAQQVGYYYFSAATTIYFTGATGTTYAKILYV